MLSSTKQHDGQHQVGSGAVAPRASPTTRCISCLPRFNLILTAFYSTKTQGKSNNSRIKIIKYK